MNRPIALSVVAAAALGLVAVFAQAQPKPGAPVAKPAAAKPASDAGLRAAIEKAVPGVTIDSIKPSIIPGYKEVAIAGRVVYVSNDGKYLIQGSLMELESRDNLTAASEGALRRGVLDAVPRERRIIFSPAKPKYRLTVFTDIDCGFCRKMHTQIADYNKAGISVEYLFFPRAGLGSESFDKAVNVWCAADRKQALTAAKAGESVEAKTCDNPIEEEFALGQKIGINGTPAVIAPDGTQLGGYVPPEQLLQRLDQIAAEKGPE